MLGKTFKGLTDEMLDLADRAPARARDRPRRLGRPRAARARGRDRVRRHPDAARATRRRGAALRPRAPPPRRTSAPRRPTRSRRCQALAGGLSARHRADPAPPWGCACRAGPRASWRRCLPGGSRSARAERHAHGELRPCLAADVLELVQDVVGGRPVPSSRRWGRRAGTARTTLLLQQPEPSQRLHGDLGPQPLPLAGAHERDDRHAVAAPQHARRRAREPDPHVSGPGERRRSHGHCLDRRNTSSRCSRPRAAPRGSSRHRHRHRRRRRRRRFLRCLHRRRRRGRRRHLRPHPRCQARTRPRRPRRACPRRPPHRARYRGPNGYEEA